jgi:histidinol-phosphatase
MRWTPERALRCSLTLAAVTMTDDLELIHQLADTADAISLLYFAAGAVPTQTKADGSPVTLADREVEQAIRDVLGTARPHDSIIGEELGGHGNASRRWIVDPIDGTSNFSTGQAEWSTLLAVETCGDIVTGMITAPALRRRWWATRSAGAWTTLSVDGDTGDREPLAVSVVATLDKATIAIWPLSSWVPASRASAGRRLVELGANGGPLSNWTGVCHGAMLVAAGVADVFFHMSADPWDIAAAVPIVEEAGGAVSDLDGGRSISSGTAVYSNGRVHREVLECLRAGSIP